MGRPSALGATPLQQQLKASLIVLEHEARVPIKDIAKKYGTSYQTIYKVLDKAGAKRRYTRACC